MREEREAVGRGGRRGETGDARPRGNGGSGVGGNLEVAAKYDVPVGAVALQEGAREEIPVIVCRKERLSRKGMRSNVFRIRNTSFELPNQDDKRKISIFVLRGINTIEVPLLPLAICSGNVSQWS